MLGDEDGRHFDKGLRQRNCDKDLRRRRATKIADKVGLGNFAGVLPMKEETDQRRTPVRRYVVWRGRVCFHATAAPAETYWRSDSVARPPAQAMSQWLAGLRVFLPSLKTHLLAWNFLRR